MIHAPIIDELMTFRSVEQRILRACKTIRVLPDPEHRFIYGSGAQGIWRETVREWQSYGSEEVKIRFIPKPFDVSDCLLALSWCNVLTRSEFNLIWWRSFDNVSYAMIAARLGRSDETARRRYEDAMRKAWYGALTKNMAIPEKGRRPHRNIRTGQGASKPVDYRLESGKAAVLRRLRDFTR